MTQISAIIQAPLGAPATVRAGTASPSGPTVTNVASAGDVTSVEDFGTSSSHFSVEIDNAAADVAAVTESLKGLADHLNSMQAFLDPEIMRSMRYALGDEAAEKWLEGIKQHIADTAKNLSDYEAYAAKTYDVSGALPARKDNGSWSYGLFSLSSHGSDFVARADSNGAVTVSVGGQSFVPWRPPEPDGRAASVSSAGIALQTLKRLNKIA